VNELKVLAGAGSS